MNRRSREPGAPSFPFFLIPLPSLFVAMVTWGPTGAHGGSHTWLQTLRNVILYCNTGMSQTPEPLGWHMKNGAGDWTQGLVLTRQVLCSLSIHMSQKAPPFFPLSRYRYPCALVALLEWQEKVGCPGPSPALTAAAHCACTRHPLFILPHKNHLNTSQNCALPAES